MAETSGNRGQSPIERAEEWVDEKTQRADGRAKGHEAVEGTPTVEDLRRQQHREMPHAGLGTDSQNKGAVLGTDGWRVNGVLDGTVICRCLVADPDTAVRVILHDAHDDL